LFLLNSECRSFISVTTRARGFSLIELLVALAILSLLLTIAASTLSALGPKFALDNTVRSVAMALSQARGQAITKGHTIAIAFDAHSFAITDTNDGGATIAADELSTLAGVSAEDIVTFTPLGMAAAPVVITVSNNASSRNVNVGITGEVTIQ
jgi:type IV fimbrial biogenesis protein FimU